MIAASGPDRDLAGRSSHIRAVWTIAPVVLSLILTMLLLPLPQPSVVVSQPYRVELLLSLFILFLIWRTDLSQGSTDRTRDLRLARGISIAILAFCAWSSASILWASFVGGVAHHTLLWILYLIFFFLVLTRLRHDAGIVVNTFIVLSLITGAICIVDYLAITDFSISELTLRARYAKSGEMFATLSPVLWAAAIYARRQRIMLSTAAALGWIVLMLSLSKGAFVAGIAGFLVFFIGAACFSQRSFRKKIVATAAAWIALTVSIQLLSSAMFAVPATVDYISGAADPSRTSTNHRLFIWNVAARMAADHWLIGVGSDNFGLVINQTRADYRKANPAVPADEIADIYLIDRAHNEPVQVLAELGVVGLALFLLPFAAFVLAFLRTLRARGFVLPPILWAAAGGICAFLISSQFSSFSFRKAQNGIVFFMVFAIGVNEIAKLSHRRTGVERRLFSHPAISLSVFGLVLMIAFCSTKLIAEYHAYRAERAPTYAQAQDDFCVAFAADREYAGAYLLNADRASSEGDPAEAARLTRMAIDNGIGLSLTYSHLAGWHEKAGDPAAAEATLREAIAIYPRSIYLHTELAVLLTKLGRKDDADAQFAHATSIDPRHARGWRSLIEEGSTEAFYGALTRPETALPAELTPYEAVLRYADASPSSVR